MTSTDYLNGLAWASAALLFALTAAVTGWSIVGYAKSVQSRDQLTDILSKLKDRNLYRELLAEYGSDLSNDDLEPIARSFLSDKEF